MNIFLSFSGEGRELYAIEFLDIYSRLGLNCWYDRHELYLGDKLHETIIEKGINKSDYCVLFINKNFLNKNWPCEEANSFYDCYVDSPDQRIFPILIDVTKEDVEKSKISRILEVKYQFLNNDNSLQNIAIQILNCILHVELMKNQIKDMDAVMAYYKRLSKHSHINIYNALKVLSRISNIDYRSRAAILICLSNCIKSDVYENLLDEFSSMLYRDENINEDSYKVIESIFILRTSDSEKQY